MACENEQSIVTALQAAKAQLEAALAAVNEAINNGATGLDDVKTSLEAALEAVEEALCSAQVVLHNCESSQIPP